MNMRGKPEMERFFQFVHFEPMSGCWLWAGSYLNHGYGFFRRTGGEGVAVHRFSYLVHKGEIPAGMHVLHLCDNPFCCNPDHLELGTHQENMAQRGQRHRQAYGTTNSHAKLTDAQVMAIRFLVAHGVTQKAVGNIFGICSPNVSRIVRGELWGHLPLCLKAEVA